jgi:two-component system, OmpR family, response regulator RegX3
MQQRVLIVEDDVITAKVISHVLGDDGFATTVVSRGRDALDAVANQATVLILLDVNLPDTDGFALALDLRAQHYTGPIIFVTGRGDLIDKLRGFEIGADDYILKPVEPMELVARVRGVVRRFETAQARGLAAHLRVDDAELVIGELTYSSDAVSAVVLAPTELRLLDCLMRNARIVISRELLIERVWGFASLSDTNRVDVYIRRLRRKIESDPNNPQYLHTVRGIGYVFRPMNVRDNSASDDMPDGRTA